MPLTPDDATVTVSDSGSLRDAYNTLSKTGGGTIAVSQGASQIEIALTGGGRDQVNIVSADSSAPTLLNRISFNDVENVTVSDFRIDSTDVSRPDWHQDLMVEGGGNIAIENSTFTSNAVGRYHPGQAGTVLGESLGRVRNTSDFSFEGNTANNYYHGLAVRETVGVSVEDNEFSAFQGDGLRLAGVQQAEIIGNHMYDFLGTSYNFNHNDFIQVWSTNTKLLTKDLTISGNILDSGDGASAQGIFVNNERFFRDDSGHRYQNIDIVDNVVYTGNSNGIAVFGANDVDITGNTLLWNVNAETVDRPGAAGKNATPLIRLTSVTDGAVTNNITPGTYVGDNAKLSGNEILNYTQPNDPDYVGTNFVDAMGGGSIDFRLRPDSPWNGVVGSSLSQAPTSNADGVDAIFTADVDRGDFHAFTFDASLSVDEDGYLGAGYDFVWTFGDGTVLQGEKVDHAFDGEGTQDVNLKVYRDGQLMDEADRSISVQSKNLLQLDLIGSATDESSYASRVNVSGARALSDGYQIGGTNRIEVDRGSQQVHDLESFGITTDLKVLNGDAGRFLLLYGTMDARIENDGAVRFTLSTDTGNYVVDSGDVGVDDGQFHELGFDYDGESLSLYIDGKIADVTDASGTTAPLGYHGLVLGSLWKAGVDAVVRDFTLNSEPVLSQPDDPVTPDVPVEKPSEPVVTPDPEETPDQEETPVTGETPDAPEETPEEPVVTPEPEETPDAEDTPVTGETPDAPEEAPEDPEDATDPDDVADPEETPDGEEVSDTPEDTPVSGDPDETPAPSPIPTPPVADYGTTRIDVAFEPGDVNGSLSGFSTGSLVRMSRSETGYRIGDGHSLEIAAETDGLHELAAFSLEMDVMADTTDLSGALLQFRDVFAVTMDDDGSLRFGLETDEGAFDVVADGAALADGAMHRLGVTYDSDMERMALSVDGQLVAEGDASGITADAGSEGLSVGDTDAGDTFGMLIDDFVFESRMADATDLLL